jgi:hypothetical protein
MELLLAGVLEERKRLPQGVAANSTSFSEDVDVGSSNLQRAERVAACSYS